MNDDSKVIYLANRITHRPDLGQLARQQIAASRAAIDATPAEYAALLSPLLSWNLTGEMVESWETSAVPPGDVIVAAGLLSQDAPNTAGIESDAIGQIIRQRFSDLSAVYPTRTDFTDNFSPADLFDDATSIDAVGLSLNLLCQQYPERKMRAILDRGARIRLLFIDPTGDAVRRYEIDEGYQQGQIAALTELNIQAISQRVRDRVSSQLADHIELRVYDETTRFNLVLIDRERCVTQPYLPGTRGVDSPTFLINRTSATLGLFPTFEQVFASLWERGTAL